MHKYPILFSETQTLNASLPLFSDGAFEPPGKTNISNKHITHGVWTRSEDREGRIWRTQDIGMFWVERRNEAGNDFGTVNYSSKYYYTVDKVEQVH